MVKQRVLIDFEVSCLCQRTENRARKINVFWGPLRNFFSDRWHGWGGVGWGGVGCIITFCRLRSFSNFQHAIVLLFTSTTLPFFL